MSKRYPGGVVSATSPTVNAAGASGLFGLVEQAQSQAANKWPPFKVANSLRFRSAASAYFNRTPASSGNRQTWTYSVWVKRGVLGARQVIFGSVNSAGNDYVALEFTSSDILYLAANDGSGGEDLTLQTNAVFRDPSSWYHIVVFFNTTNATASNRAAIYVNGVLQSLSTATYMAQNYNGRINTTNQHNIVSSVPAGSNYFDGYLSEVNFVDGQALTPSSFGGTDKNGVWSPIAYTGSYGTNGFYLPFNETTSATTLGYDKSGNNNNWTLNGFNVSTANATYDIVSDAPVDQQSGDVNRPIGNYATLNPLHGESTSGWVAPTFSNGSLSISTSLSNNQAGGNYSFSTQQVTSGKWYAEFTCGTRSGIPVAGNDDFGVVVGIAPTAAGNYSPDVGVVYKATNGQVRIDGAGGISYGNSYTTGDVIGVALDMDNGKVWFAKNGTWQNSGDPVAGTNQAASSRTGLYGIGLQVNTFANAGAYTTSASANFGQRPFAYTPPSGFKSLCTTNLPDPTIKQPNRHFDVKLYAGSGGAQNITGFNFGPEFVWLKDRTGTAGHSLHDAVRGSAFRLVSSSANVEADESASFTGFTSNGFSLAGNDTSHNNSSRNYVAWCWDAASSNTTNTSGTISSQVRASQTAGFSVVTYTGTGANATVGHGLGVTPKMVIVKCRTQTRSWPIYHAGVGNTGFVQLQATTAALFTPNLWNNTTPTSSVFSLGSDPETNGTQNYVAYCFAEIEGYSKMGSYTGNGSTDGPFVYCGFRPKWILFKNASAGSTDWKLFDSSRNTSNIVTSVLYPNLTNAEETNTGLDFVSNGFKWRDNGSAQNGSGNSIIFAAFAESPFKYSRAR